MLVKRIRIINHQQFGDLDIKLTYPEGHEKAGLPLEKVCFIGRNGTGKTTLLNYLKKFYTNCLEPKRSNDIGLDINRGVVAFYVEVDNLTYAIAFFPRISFNDAFVDKNFDSFIQECTEKKFSFTEEDLYFERYDIFQELINRHKATGTTYFNTLDRLVRRSGKFPNNVVIYSPLDSTHYLDSSKEKIEEIDIEQAISIYNKVPVYHDVSFKNLENVFKFITYEMQRRIEKQDEFENNPENIKKSKEELLKEFDKIYPDIIKELSNKWDIILDSEGLEFDKSKATKPTQFINNINHFIKSKTTNELIETLRLSSGTLSIILRLGYLTALYNSRKINIGIALFDEPENSLFPDVLYNIVDTYISVTHNTQFFFATHSPIVAAQFEPCERVILDFDETHKVYAKQGIAPLGDDPNDLLRQDFGRKDLMNEKGLEMWERYKAVKDLLSNASNENEKTKLLNEFMDLQKTYHFPAI